ncbi:MAG: Ldh family oxidoreductase [Candidatus Marinimicrobia bacterium]|nr:Ldh family oxidoreductase [Candidatus Neomarinimicrobiota bacterium]
MKIAVKHLENIIISLLEKSGAGKEESQIVAQVMIKADMRGIPTHGIYFLPMLLDRIKLGLLEVPTKMLTISDEGAVVHLDGGNGLGQVAAEKGMQMSIQKASQNGIGLTLIRNTNHIGVLAYYSALAAKEGMIGICMSSSAAAIAPWGGTEAFFGTNPFSLAAPGTDGFPIVLDMSTSVTARGKIRMAQRKSEKIPFDWAIDKNGIPTNDPNEALNGTLLPIGGPKGYGLAFFIDLMCGILSGSKFSREISTFHKPLSPTGVGIMTIAIDISRFMPLDTFLEIIKNHANSIRFSEKGQNVDRIYLPGEIEASKENEAYKEGIEIDPDVFETIDLLLKDNGISIELAEGAQEK